MNKFLISLLAILGGVELVFYLAMPIIIAIFWMYLIGLSEWASYLFVGVCLLATLFRAIKIGFLRN